MKHQHLRHAAALTLTIAFASVVVSATGCSSATTSSSGPTADTETKDPTVPTIPAVPTVQPTPAACTGSADAAGGGARCDGALDVATDGDVLAQLTALAEAADTTIRPESGIKLLPSRDLRATAEIVVDITAFREAKPACPPPAEAGTSPGIGGCNESIFVPEKPFHRAQNIGADEPRQGAAYPAGVTCAEDAPSGCERIRIAAGTTVRFQRIVERSFYNKTDSHFIRVVRGCWTECAADEVRCEASTMCVRTGKDYCILCNGEAAGVCACREGCGAKADGAKCAYESSDDTHVSGTCGSGACSSK